MPFGKIRREQHITRPMVRAKPRTIFVFGDNMARAGFGGQAKEMRGEPNALGIPTKWRPAKDEAAYFKDADFHMNSPVHFEIRNAFSLIVGQLIYGDDVVLPDVGIGVGLSDLWRHAPAIYTYIHDTLELLEEIFNERNRK